MTDELFCDICGLDIGLSSHYHCSICNELCSVMGHPHCYKPKQNEEVVEAGIEVVEVPPTGGLPEYERTPSGDRLLMLLLTQPDHPEVLEWVDQARASHPGFDNYSDERIIELSIQMFTFMCKSKGGDQ